MDLCSVEPSIAQILRREPLMAFSIYTAGQVAFLIEHGKRLQAISKGWKQPDGSVVVSEFNEYYYNFWLWVLGSYEVTRTMDQNRKSCFSAEAGARISSAKAKLALIRMPFAKQERERTREPISSENSILGADKGMIFRVKDVFIDSDDLIEEIIQFFQSFTIEEILERIPTSPPAQ